MSNIKDFRTYLTKTDAGDRYIFGFRCEVCGFEVEWPISAGIPSDVTIFQARVASHMIDHEEEANGRTKTPPEEGCP